MSSIARAKVVCVFVVVSVSAAWGEHPEGGAVQRSTTEESSSVTSDVKLDETTNGAVPIFRLPESCLFQRIVVGHLDSAGTVASSAPVDDEKRVYRSTRGKFAASIPSPGFVADDFTLLTTPGCQLRRNSFQLTGRADPEAVARGAYQVEFALYDDCPSAGGRIIPHTIDVVRIPANQDSIVQEVEFLANRELEIALPPTVWLWLKADRLNVGVIIGAPAEVGYTGDRLDYPGFSCNAHFGGFPGSPHASFTAELWVDNACPAAFPGYRNLAPGRGAFTEGTSRCFADDLLLHSHPCEMVGYEVHVRGVGTYRFALREDADGLPGAVIPRSSVSRVVSPPVTGAQLLRFAFDPPIALPDKVWMTFQGNNPGAGWILTRKDADLGRTARSYAYSVSGRSCTDVNDWATKNPSDSTAHGGFDVTLTCAGPPPVGACCDMYQPNENGDVMCSETPRMNCPFPGNAERDLGPQWVPGASCHPDPFPHPCGQSACCKPDDTCENLTQKQCASVEPEEMNKVWQQGAFCEKGHQACPFSACVQARVEDDCRLPHANPGCFGPQGLCCHYVCTRDLFCCTMEWDRLCVEEAFDVSYCQVQPINDDCAAETPWDHGALQIAIPSTTAIDGRYAQSNWTDPPFCCNIGLPRACVGGSDGRFPCDTNRHCPGGVCADRVLEPWAQAEDTVWFKFTATRTSAQLHTLFSEPDALDTLVQVFSVGDPTTDETACSTLTSIGCNDDAPDEALANDSEDRRSELCVKDLVPGQTYYVLLGTKRTAPSVLYRLNIVSPCPFAEPRPLNDLCADALTLHDLQPLAFDLRDALAECPLGACAAFAKRDLWYNYTAPCDGRVKLKMRSPDVERAVDASIAVYRGCDCPGSPETLMACASNEIAQPTEPDGLTFPVRPGQCYTLRLGNDFEGLDPSRSSDAILTGELQAECVSCPPGPVEWIDPPSGVIDARLSLFRDETLTAGIETFRVAAPPRAHRECWRLCETGAEPVASSGTGNVDYNSIEAVEEDAPGSYRIRLKRTITPQEFTTITYTDNAGTSHQGVFAFLPGDVNGTALTDSDDVDALVSSCLERNYAPAWGDYSCDINQSGTVTSADLLELIDRFHGARGHRPWNGISLRHEASDCPPFAP